VGPPAEHKKQPNQRLCIAYLTARNHGLQFLPAERPYFVDEFAGIE